jgi:tubulin-specific chaperone E
LADIRKELEKVNEQQEGEVIAKHPRYAELCEEYGTPTIKRLQGTEDKNPNLIKFRFFTREVKTTGYKPIFERVLFKYFTVYDLFFYAAQSFKANPLDIHLYWITKAQQAKMYRLENTTDVLRSEKRPSEQTEAGWVTTEVELSRSTRLLDLVFYDEVTSIRIEAD